MGQACSDIGHPESEIKEICVIMSRLNHVGVPKLLDLFVLDNSLFMVSSIPFLLTLLFGNGIPNFVVCVCYSNRSLISLTTQD